MRPLIIAYELETLQTGLSVFIEPTDLSLSSAGALLDRFNYDVDLDDPLTAKPLGMVLNPEVRGVRVYVYDDVWLIPYRRSFRAVVIKHSRYASGPHACRLYYRSEQTQRLYWIATLQICDVMFYSEEKMLATLIECRLSRAWYISPKSRKDIIPV